MRTAQTTPKKPRSLVIFSITRTNCQEFSYLCFVFDRYYNLIETMASLHGRLTSAYRMQAYPAKWQGALENDKESCV